MTTDELLRHACVSGRSSPKSAPHMPRSCHAGSQFARNVWRSALWIASCNSLAPGCSGVARLGSKFV
jgi:hypothetical protein